MDEPTPTGSPETSRRVRPEHVQKAAAGGLLEARDRRLGPGPGRYRRRPHLQHDCRKGFLKRTHPNESAGALRLPTRVATERRLLEIKAWRQAPSRAIRRRRSRGKKQKPLRVDDVPEYGDVWTFCAIDAETKLVPSFKCGKRDLATAKVFVSDVASRMTNRVQISADALRAYVDAIEQVFGTEVDFGQIVKTYEHDESQHPGRKYSAPEFVSVEKRAVTGHPDMDLVSTSYIERLNATTRLHMRRLTRLTLAFSKKLENFEAAVALHFAYYNLVKRHGTLRCTPAMAARVERDFCSVGDLVEATA